ncbi:MAG: choice-of-anchor Q domain-containing protein [Solirubrobacterales bacterium]
MSERSIRRAREQRQAAGHSRLAKTALGAGSALGATVLLAPAAQADTIEVTNLEDTGDGSLPTAITEANTNGEADLITFASGLSGTIEIDEDLQIRDEPLEIQGPGASVITIDGQGIDQVFYLLDFDEPNTPVTISGLTVTGGDTAGASGGYGGGIESIPFFGEPADLTLADMVITGNYAASDGGGVYVEGGSLTVVNSLITANEAGDRGGGIYLYGAAGDAATQLTVTNTTISDNLAEGDGGGVYVGYASGDAVFQSTTVANNTSNEDAGGISFRGDGGDDAGLTLDATTVSGNSAEEAAGGVWFLGPSGPSVVRNSTISGNSAYYGGGISAFPFFDEPIAVTNSTIVDNQAEATGFASGGGIFLVGQDDDADGETDTLTLSSTIVANNSSGEGGEDVDGSAGTFATGFSLIEDPTVTGGATLAETPAGSNLFGVDPQLGPLAGNGGPTLTHLPAPTSPALDVGVNNNLQTDQRGLARTQDLSAIANGASPDGSDIGAVEVQAADCQGQGALRFDGTDGDDTLTGTDGPDAIAGLGGNDTASAGGGNDCVSGDQGNDKLKGGAGKDQVNGGAGKDRLAGNGGKDNLKGAAGKDNLKGGGGKDKLSGGGGKDKLAGGGGKDKLKGGPGKDKLKAAGGGKDKVNCGGGKDKVIADAKDKVSQSCEKVVVKA